MCIRVPYPRKPKTTVLRLVFDGVNANIDSTTVTLMMVSDRAEAWSIYKKMSKCLFAGLYGHWVLDDDSVVANARENEVVIEMTCVKTQELIKEGRDNSVVVSGGTLRRTGFKGYVGASTVNPDNPIRKQEEHNKRMMKTVVMKDKLADNDLHTRHLEDQVQSLMEISASMAALLDISDDATSQEFQDKMRKMAENFKS